ncbi:hypothetical protein, partial [Klebsiella pneumoniae]|uniref:hypothetical protein n=1 Tax=Klebsiella pneumoniae TaxID=573 RepID=UPI0040556492
TKFAKHLSSTFTPQPTQNHQHSISVEDFLSSPIPLSLPPKAVNPSEVKYLLKNLPYRKSPGGHNINNYEIFYMNITAFASV